MTYEELVNEAKRLRGESERAQARFFLWLMAVERDHEETWRTAGCEHFDQVINSNHLGTTARYRLFVAGCNVVGPKAALEHGAAWVFEAGKMKQPTPEAVASFAALASDFEQATGLPASQQTAERWRKDVDPRPALVTGPRVPSELDRLRAENAELKAKLRAAEAEIRRLKRSAA